MTALIEVTALIQMTALIEVTALIQMTALIEVTARAGLIVYIFVKFAYSI